VATHLPCEWPADARVLAIDLDVRDRSDAAARHALLSAAHLGHAERVFVKIDSTLRGPLTGLIYGALDAFAREYAVVAPAFPEQGRHLRDGRLYVHGEPGASLRDVFGATDATVIRASALSREGLSASRCLIIDAETSSDLRSVAEAVAEHPDWLLVGSAGLARQLAPPHQRASAPATRGDVLVVAGSPTVVTREQLQRLDGLRNVTLLTTPPTDERDAGEAAAALADTVLSWSERHAPGAVVLTGGATARAVSHRLGATSLRLLGELEPGVPIGQLQAGIWHGVTVVTKAGGFGTRDTLLDVVRALGVSSA
jgi:uncharacterized protein YgbK (DUF1537 family)